MNTGSPVVDAIGKMAFEGNIIPSSWYRHITWSKGPNKGRDAGKADRLAIEILADLIYWYRPLEDRDEATGQLRGWAKKFKADMLQRSYSQIADFFCCSKREAVAAVGRLVELGLVRQEFRTVTVRGVTLNNVMYLEPVPERVAEITYRVRPPWRSDPSPQPNPRPRAQTSAHPVETPPIPRSNATPSHGQTSEGPALERDTLPRSNVRGSPVLPSVGPPFQRGTNTEISSETTLETSPETTSERERAPAGDSASPGGEKVSLSLQIDDEIISDPVAYVEAQTGRNLAPGVKQTIHDVVGGDLGLWRETVDAWIEAGINPANIGCVLDWFEDPSRVYGGPGPLGEEKLRREGAKRYLEGQYAHAVRS